MIDIKIPETYIDKFADLEPAEVFIIDCLVYMKLHDNLSDYNAVNLRTGNLITFCPSDTVIPLGDIIVDLR